MNVNICRMRTRCGEGCSSGGTVLQTDFVEMASSTSCRKMESITFEKGNHLL